MRTRFAPSPTGGLHLGGIRTALFSWLYSKKNNGKFFLRLEDTDILRHEKGSVGLIFESMEWLGLDTSGNPLFQSRNSKRYQDIANSLLNNNLAYRCYCSKDRLERVRSSQIENRQKPRYDNHCREKNFNLANASKPHVIRFKNSEKDTLISWKDQIKGIISISSNELDDFVIQRTDGSFTYNFCTVIDDIDMKITHVIRGDDHVSNTPKQINIYKALRAKIPFFAHLPMILGENGKKLSKRDHPLNIIEYRKMGYLPDAIINYLVRLGWSSMDEEFFTKSQLLDLFDLTKIHSSPAMFDNKKLNWMNGIYIRNSSFESLSKELLWHFSRLNIDIKNGPALNELIPIMSKKYNNLRVIAEESMIFYKDSFEFDEKFLSDYLNLESKKILSILLSSFENMDNNFWKDSKNLFLSVKKISIDKSIKISKIGFYLRIFLTGKSYSPDLGVTLKWIGKTRTLQCLYRAIKKCV